MEQALALLKDGSASKMFLPEWEGYWFLDKETQQVMVLSRDGHIYDTPLYHIYGHRIDWVVKE